MSITRLLASCLLLLALHAAADTLVPATGPNDPIPPRYLYGVTAAGQMLVYVDNSTDAGASWIATAVTAPAIAGVNWASYLSVFSGGDGVIYAVDTAGNLRYFRLLDPWRNAVAMSWSADSNSVIGFGFAEHPLGTGFSRLGSSGPGYMATSLIRNGAMWFSGGFFYQHSWLNGGLVSATYAHSGFGQTLANTGPAVPAPCASCFRFMEGGDGLSLFLQSVFGDPARLMRYRVGPRGQAVAGPIQIGEHWESFVTVFAAPGSYLIEGYVSTAQPVPGTGRTIAPVSVAPGETVKIRASTFSPSYTARLLRLQRHSQDDATNPGGLIDGVVVGSPVTVTAGAGGNFKKAQNSQMSFTGANWAGDGADILLPADARSGIYAAELTTPSGGRYLAPFIVRPAPSAAAKPIAVIANISTWNAYNDWGGTSRYTSIEFPERTDQAGQPGFDLSYERPFLETPFSSGAIGGVGLIQRDPRGSAHLTRAEVWVTSWLDTLAAQDARYGYDVFTDIDLHAGTAQLEKYRTVVIDSHPEYWTDAMRDRLDAFLAAGGHLVYVAGNGLYDRVLINDDGSMRIPNGLGGNCGGGQNGANPCPPRNLFRLATAAYPNGRSERATLGSTYETWTSFTGTGSSQPFQLLATHPFLTSAAGTPLGVGSLVGNVAGLDWDLKAAAWEVQEYDYGCGDFPFGVCTPSHSTLVGTNLATAAAGSLGNIVFRQVAPPSGCGWVFSVGSITASGVLAVDPQLQRITRNAIDSVGYPDASPPALSCPAHVSANRPAGSNATVLAVSYPAPVASDNCTGLALAANPVSGALFPLGTTTVNVSATDSSGAAAACSFTVSVDDADADGVTDSLDNCSMVANGPLIPDSGGHSQLDTNGDGYGNLCDGDLNNTALTTAADFSLFRTCLNQPASASALCAAADMNGSGVVTSADFNRLRAQINMAPGPSGLHP